MKFAAITDPNGFNMVTQSNLGYHLVLAQYVLSDPRYAEYYRRLSDLGHFIILDNGCAERIQLTPNEIVKAANMVKADEVAFQDVWEDIDGTLDIFQSLENKVPSKHRMVIPQGKTIEEWIECLEVMRKRISFRSIGVPKHIEAKGGRVRLLNILSNDYPDLFSYHDIHLLGIWNNPITEVRELARRFPWIRGIDSAAPFAFAQHDTLIDSKIPHLSHVWGNFFKKSCAMNNIQIMIDLCRGV